MGNPDSPDVVLLSFPLMISFQSIFSESDNGEVIRSHLFEGPVWQAQPGGPVMKDFCVEDAVCLDCGLVLTYAMKSLYRSAKAMLSLGWVQIWNFSNRNHILIDH